MEIDINQKKISIGDKYKIFTDGQQTHTATRALFKLMPEINLFENGGGRAKMTINKRFSWLSAKYDITRWDNNVLEFRTTSFWKVQYQLQCGVDTYDIYGHRGRKYSVYKNDKQVAWWVLNIVIILVAVMAFSRKKSAPEEEKDEERKKRERRRGRRR